MVCAGRPHEVITRMRSVINFGHRTTYSEPATADPDGAATIAPSRHAFRAPAGEGEGLALGVWLLASQRLYWARICSVRTVEITRLAKVALLLGVLVGASSSLVGVDIRAAEAAVGGVATMMFLLTFRSGYRGWLRDRRREGRFCRAVVLVGLNEEALDMHRLLDHHPELGFRVTAVLGDRQEAARLGMASLWAGEVADAVALARSSSTTGAVVVASAVPSDELNRTIRELMQTRSHVHVTSGLRGFDHRRL